MKGAIMQPYLFPFLPYFQLIFAVDVFGVADDSQFINRGWVNRNRILINNSPLLFTFSLKKDQYHRPIKARYFHDNFDYEKRKFIKTLELNYNKAPYYKDTIELIREIFNYDERNISKFIENQLKIICRYINIKTPFINSSLWQIDNMDNLQLEERVIKSLKKINISHFINPVGGSELYTKKVFDNNKIKLDFLKPLEIYYKQFESDFVPNLSIIDVMMFNSREEIELMLGKYKLI